MAIVDRLVDAVGAARVRTDVPLAPYTTFRVGGPADWFVETWNEAETLAALNAARVSDIPVLVLGGGSNLLVGDRGVRGLVIRPRGTAITAPSPAEVRAESGVTINGLVRWTIHRGLAGIEAWAGTPGTVGGAVYGNAHFGGRNIGDVILRVHVVDRTGATRMLDAGDMALAYDDSRLQHTGEVLLSAVFRVREGADPAGLRAIARESLRHRKATQPLDIASAGCIFQNPDAAMVRLPAGVPPSAGALIDRAGLKGRAIGDAVVSPTHANFILNTGHASAADIRRLIDLCKAAVSQKFGVDLKEEIRIVGEF